MTPEEKIIQSRSEFALADGVIYFNSASAGPLPKRSRLALDAYYQLTTATPWKSDDKMANALQRSRELGARMLGVNIEDIMYGYNTGHGINLAAFGLPLESGDEVIVADNDFPANVYPWLALRERGVVVRFAKTEKRSLTVETLQAEITNRTKVIAVSFVQFYNGIKSPLAEFSKLAKSCGAYFVVDGIQGCGVEPINVRELEIDVFSAGGQKWLLSPSGIGLVTVSARARKAMSGAMYSWLSVEWENFLDLFQYEKSPFADARRFSLGTPPVAHIVALEQALGLLTDIGVENIQRHNRALQSPLVKYLEESADYQILSSTKESERSAILSFTSDNYEEVFKRLIAAKIICVMREGGIRVSTHIYNTPEDISKLISLL